MKKNDYISDGLVHVRDRLKGYAHPADPERHAAPASGSEGSASPPHHAPASKSPVRNPVASDAELKKARIRRGEEYLRFHRDLTSKLTACQAVLTGETRRYQDILDESARFQETLGQMLKELEALRDLDGSLTDDPVRLGENFRKAEHLRLEFIRRQTAFAQLTEEHESGRQNGTASAASLLPELGSLEFSQIFKIGLACSLPAIIAILAGCAAIAFAILVSMGVLFR